ncbi:calcium and integrin-binding protein 1 [Lepidochelys kempii]|uniref:calcium and integrin-binding protein 1 n=1 Tax=Lepidochelys kempii TaxID=8472 RepID=UPI003C700FEC
MGGSASQLPRDLLDEYQELTFLTKQEICWHFEPSPLCTGLCFRVWWLLGVSSLLLSVASGFTGCADGPLELCHALIVLVSQSAHKRFSELLPKEERESILLKRVPKSKILTLPELRANPFQDRICRVFSTAEDGDGSMSFEDFLDLLSVFSDSATVEIKSHYAFRIFDFDDDGILDRKDLEKLVNCLTGEGDETRLSESEMDQLIQNILEESDIDKDGTINLSEFQHVISRSPDFASSFKIVL